MYSKKCPPGLCKRILESTTISAFAAGASNTLAERTAISGFLTSLSKTLHNLQSKGGKEAKNKKKTATTTRLSPILKGTTMPTTRLQTFLKTYENPHTVALSILIILNLPFSKRSKETAAIIRNPLAQSNIEQHGLASFDCPHRVQNTQPGHHMLTPTNPRMERSLSMALCGALFWCTGFGHIQTEFKMFPEPTQG